MDTESPSANLKKSWISEHPRVVIGFILVVCLGPFINKAVHTDDALFVWSAEWIQGHPLDFLGGQVNWWMSATPMWVANWNPPLMSYFLAGVAALFGWHETVLHLACLAIAFMAATGIYSLAQMWCDRPLLATVVAIFTPAFLVSSTTLMSDVLMLTFWIWALVLWERALASEKCWWRFVSAGVLAGLAVLTKYSAVTLLPLLGMLSLLRTRKPGWWLLGLAVPLIMMAGYEWFTTRMYGRGLLSAAAHYAQTYHAGFSGGWKAKGIIGLAFAGGSLLPLLFFAPWLWQWRTLLAGGVLFFGVWLVIFRTGGNLGLVHPWQNPSLMNYWDFALQVALLTVAGLHLLLLATAELWRRRDIGSTILVLWLVGVLVFATILNWTVSARSFLPVAPAAAILLVRRLEAHRGNSPKAGRMIWPLIPAATIALILAIADFHLANSARTAAQQITAQYKPADHHVWFEGHGAFQYYMEKLGGQPLDIERSVLQPGDVVALPWIGHGRIPFPIGSVGWVGHLQYRPGSWMNVQNAGERGTAGFYDANAGPVPFALGAVPPQDYYVVKVFSRVQYNTQPVNGREVLGGGLPVYTNASFVTEDKRTFPGKPEAIRQSQLAGQLEAEGRIEEAIQHYRAALAVDSNNPVVLDDLAWILATAGRPELRKNEEAVRLATRAVELTDGTQPIILMTLAAAYAEGGQFPKATQIADVARVLALLTTQPDVAAKIDRLMGQYSARRTAGATAAP